MATRSALEASSTKKLHPYLNNVLDQLEQLVVEEIRRTKGQELSMSMVEIDIRKSLTVLKKSLLVFSIGNMDHVTQTLMQLARKHPCDRDVEGKRKPKKIDEKEIGPAEELGEDGSAEYTVLNILASLFDSNNASDGPPMPASMLQFCASYLDYTYSAPIRHQAGRALAALSEKQMSEVMALFVERSATVKKDEDEREFVPYMKAMGMLRFSLETEESSKQAISFVDMIVAFSDRVKRGVLKGAVCHTMRSFAIMVASKKEAFQAFAADSRAPAFWRQYAAFLQIVNKWAKTTAYALFCMHVSEAMLCNSNEDFWTTNGPAFIKIGVAHLKEKEERLQTMELLAQYVEHTPAVYVEHQFSFFSTVSAEVTTGFFPKKDHPSAAEAELMQRTLIRIGRHNANLGVAALIRVLREKTTGNAQKAVCLRCLRKLAETHAFEVRGFNELLCPLLDDVMRINLSTDPKTKKEEKDAALLAAAIAMFPTIVSDDISKAVKNCSEIAGLTMHEEKEVALAAIQSCQEHMHERAGDFFYTLLTDIAKRLSDIRLRDNVLMRAFKNLMVLLETYSVYAGSNSPVPDTQDQWRDLRALIDGVCILWLAHPEKWVRSEALQVADLFGKECFRSLSPGGPQQPWLCDTLRRLTSVFGAGDGKDALPDDVAHLLQYSWEDHASGIVWAWSALMSADWSTRANDTDSEWKLWKTRLRFLSAALKINDGLSQELTGRTDPGVHATPAPSGSPPATPTDQPAPDLPAPPAKVWRPTFTPAQIHDFVGRLVELLHGDEKVTVEIMSALRQLPSVCDGIIVARMELAVEGYNQKITNKELKKGHAKRVFATDEKCLRVLAELLHGGSLAAQDHLTVIYNVVSGLAIQWVKTEMFSGESVKARKAASQIMTKFVQHMNPKMGEEAAVVTAVEVFRFFTKLLTEFGTSRNASLEDNIDLENTVLKGMVVLAQHAGPLKDETVEQEVVGWMGEVGLRGQHVEQPQRKVLAMVLEHNPHLADLFFENTYHMKTSYMSDGRDGGMEVPLPESRMAFLGALVDNFLQSAEKWLERGIHKARMLYPCLHFMKSSLAAERLVALEIASLLAKDPVLRIGNPVTVAKMTHDKIPVYLEAAMKYSESIADRMVDVTTQLFAEATKWLQTMDEKDQMEELQVLAPWTRNMGPLVIRAADYPEQNATAALEAMFVLTKLFGPSNGRPASVHFQSLWTNIFVAVRRDETADNLRMVMDTVTAFLIAKFVQAYEPDNDARDVHMVVTIIMALGRTDTVELVASLADNLLDYYAPTNLKPNDYFAMHKRAEKEGDHGLEDAPLRHACFFLLHHVAFEHDAILSRVLPRIMMNTMVILSPKSKNECLLLLRHLVHSFGIRNATSMMERRDAEAALALLSADEQPFFPYNPEEKGSEAAILQLVTLISTKLPNFRRDWAEEALKWATQSTANSIALPSLQLYYTLSDKLQFDHLQRLAMLTMVALREDDHPRTELLLKIFARATVWAGATDQCRDLAVDIAAICLSAGSVPSFLATMDIILTVCKQRGVTETLRRVAGIWLKAGHSLDVGVGEVTFMGLTDERTRRKTFYLYEMLARGFASELSSSSVFAICLLLHAVHFLADCSNADNFKTFLNAYAPGLFPDLLIAEATRSHHATKRAKALYDYEPEDASHLAFRKDDVMTVEEMKLVSKDWFHGHIDGAAGGAAGMVPASYVEILPPDEEHPLEPGVQLARALYDHRPEDGKHLGFKKGDILAIEEMKLRTDDWLRGELNGQVGIVPATFVEIIYSEEPEPPPPQPATAIKRAKALFDYQDTKEPSHLPFAKGDVLTIDEIKTADWYVGSLNGKSGLVAANYVEIFSDMSEQLTPLKNAIAAMACPAAAARRLVDHAHDHRTFLDAFAQAYLKLFPTRTQFDQCIESLVGLLEGGVVTWRNELLAILHAIVAHAKYEWPWHQFARTATVAVDAFFNTSRAISPAADMLTWMHDKVPENVSANVFNFHRPKLPRRIEGSHEYFFANMTPQNYHKCVVTATFKMREFIGVSEDAENEDRVAVAHSPRNKVPTRFGADDLMFQLDRRPMLPAAIREAAAIAPPEPCTYCREKFPVADLQTHMEQCPKRPVACQHCGQKFAACALRQHGEECPERPLTCPHCATSRKARQHDDHVASCDLRPEPCSHCAVKFPFRDAATHAASCSLRPVSCPHCSTSMAAKELDTHTDMCNLRPVPCQHCQINFPAKDQPGHTATCDQRPEKCPHCFGTMPHKDVATHVPTCDVRPETCEQCKEPFPANEVAQHKTQQCPMRPRSCKHCDTSMPHKELAEHLQTCDLRPVRCTHCSGSFAARDHGAHLEICPLRPMECPHCSAPMPHKDLMGHVLACEQRPVDCVHCKAKIPARELSAHIETCDLRPGQCRHCQRTLPVRDLPPHQDACDMRPQTCRHCNRDFAYKDHSAHEESCEMRPMTCQFCTKNWPMRDFDRHCATCDKRPPENSDDEEVPDVEEEGDFAEHRRHEI